MNLLLIDFETSDKAIGLDLGAGYIFPSLFKVLGWSSAFLDTTTRQIQKPCYARYSDGWAPILLELISKSDGIIAHNAQYEVGILQFLGVDIFKLKVYDTMIIAKLYDNNLFQYNLEALSKKYLTQELRKNKHILGEVVKKHRLMKTPTGAAINTETKTYLTRATKWAYNNMDKIQELEPEIMAEYCNQDLIATGNLFIKMVNL